jgi:exodeoxyribonuclease VII large subunit
MALTVRKDVSSRMQYARQRVDEQSLRISNNLEGMLSLHEKLITRVQAQLNDNSGRYLKTRSQDLNNIGKLVNNLDPENVLKRGYSITLKNGKAVRDASEIEKGDLLDTVLWKGTIQSIAEPLKNKTNE